MGLQSQNSYLIDWQNIKLAYLTCLLEKEAPPPNLMCQMCNISQGTIRCQECFLNPFLCDKCCLKSHANLPFHKIQRWNNQCFTPTSLCALGYIMYLGHDGKPCPMAYASAQPNSEEDSCDPSDPDYISGEGLALSNMTLVDVTGVFAHKVHWCSCEGATTSRDHQLLRVGLFPASYKNPRTAFTFNVLDHFHIDAMECKTSAYNFYQKLRRLTDNVFPDSVPVSHFLLMAYSNMSDMLNLG